MADHFYSHLHLPLEGPIKEGGIFPILYLIYKNGISGILVLKTDSYEKQLMIEDGKIVFATSDRPDDSFSDYLLKKRLIDKSIYNKASEYMQTQNKRFGRALLELGYFSYEQIWTWIPEHLETIVRSIFNIRCANYQIKIKEERDIENISLDLDILSVIVDGMRCFKEKSFLENTFSNYKHLYIYDAKMMSRLDLKPYEIHVFELVRRSHRLEDILKWSELMEFDTLRLLYLFLVLEIISPRKVSQKRHTASIITQDTPRSTSFISFDEALRHYNLKYEIIYKVMLKQIGPISHSLLLKAIEDILDNLPPYLHKVQLKTDGTLDEDQLLKAVWYHDFDQHIGDFLRGLEEILYTEIFAVKKHLGVEFEQQVLKWINGIET